MLPSSINSILAAEIIFQNVIGLCFDFTTFDIRWCLLLFWSQQKPSCLSLYCCFRTFVWSSTCVLFLFVSEIEVDSILNYAIHASLGEYWGGAGVNHVLCWCIFIVCIVALCLMASNVIAMAWCDYTRHRRAVNDAHVLLKVLQKRSAFSNFVTTSATLNWPAKNRHETYPVRTCTFVLHVVRVHHTWNDVGFICTNFISVVHVSAKLHLP